MLRPCRTLVVVLLFATAVMCAVGYFLARPPDYGVRPVYAAFGAMLILIVAGLVTSRWIGPLRRIGHWLTCGRRKWVIATVAVSAGVVGGMILGAVSGDFRVGYILLAVLTPERRVHGIEHISVRLFEIHITTIHNRPNQDLQPLATMLRLGVMSTFAGLGAFCGLVISLPEKEPQHRWYRFSLRALLLVMLVFVLIVAIVTSTIRSAETPILE